MSALDHFRLLRADARTEIHDLTLDSRTAGEGSLFLALHGAREDGADYAKEAAARGAVCVVTEHAAEGVPCVLVPDAHEAAAKLAARWYGEPAGRMTVVGVTGTNGKTTTTYLLKQLLERCLGAKVGLIGTNQNMIGDAVLPAERTTPDALTLQRLLREMADAGCTHVVMEVSSHAISLERIGGIHFDVAAFTNLTEDHLDFHKTMDAYCEAKAELFRRCRLAVVNADDSYSDRILAAAACPVLTTGVHRPADLRGEDLELLAQGIRFTAVSGEERAAVSLPIPGKFTVYNALTVMGIAKQLGISLTDCAAALKTASGVKGRVEVVPTPGKPYSILIDYAHTPDGLENVLSSVKDFCKGRVIAVFGCGGDRDPMKRPIMGHIGVKLSDFAVITSDNPRTEDPMAIIEDILTGVKQEDGEYIVIEDRRAAIRYAMDIGKKDDIIILAGKGHETYQDIGGVKRHLDEREEVAAHLREKEETAWEN